MVVIEWSEVASADEEGVYVRVEVRIICCSPSSGNVSDGISG